MFTVKWLRFIPLILFIILGILLYRGLSLDPTELPSALLNQPFPDFKLNSLTEANRLLTKADLIGKPLLVNVWATWCPSCREEHQQLLIMAQQYHIDLIGLNYKDDRNAAIQWLQLLGNPYRFVIDDPQGSLGLDLGVYGAPETYLIDAKGIIQYRHIGAINAEDAQKLIQLLQNQAR